MALHRLSERMGKCFDALVLSLVANTDRSLFLRICLESPLISLALFLITMMSKRSMR